MAATGYRTLSAQKVVSAVPAAVPAAPAVVSLAIGEIALDGGTQMRAGINAAAVAEYADTFAESRGWGAFPPVEVVYDGSSYWLWDGFHRVAAFRDALRRNPAAMAAEVHARVRPGTRRDAILAAAGANAAHGLRRTADDKRRTVDALLSDPEWGQWSDAAIARAAVVSAPFVASRRELLGQSAAVAGSIGGVSVERRYVDKHGHERTMNTSGITASRAASAAPSVVPSSAAGSRQNGAALAKCSVCGRPLSDPVHAAAGMGPVCACRQVGGGGAEDDAEEIERVTVPRMAILSGIKTRWLAVIDDLSVYERETGDRAGSRALRNLIAAAIARLDGVTGA